jgi:hypothetical protein
MDAVSAKDLERQFRESRSPISSGVSTCLLQVLGGRGAAASGQPPLLNRNFLAPNGTDCLERLSHGQTFLRASLDGGGVSRLMPAPATQSMIRPALPPTASRCGSAGQSRDAPRRRGVNAV